ncbi:MAG: hypothetical protein PQJ58_02680 [Spirochaetales bacterium]|nr:hypothetical protein [Spirochaetales bacterium]
MKTMLKIKSKYVMVGATLALTVLGSCSKDFLEEVTYGEVSPSEMAKAENVEKAIIAAYSVLNGQIDNASNAYNSPASNWSFGDVVSDDCYKGGGGTGDQNQIHQMELYVSAREDRAAECWEVFWAAETAVAEACSIKQPYSA